jgi:hypothetical protein
MDTRSFSTTFKFFILLANVRLLNVSSNESGWGFKVTIIRIRHFESVRLSRKTLVSFESRYGMCKRAAGSPTYLL